MNDTEKDFYKSLWTELKAKTNDFTVDKGEVLATPETAGRVGDLLSRYYNKVTKSQDGEYVHYVFEGSKKLQNSFDESWVEDEFNTLTHMNEDFDEMSFYDRASLSFDKIGHRDWKAFVMHEAKKRWDKLVERGKDKEGWTVEDALVYGLERIEDVDYNADFDITEEEFNDMLDELKSYAVGKKSDKYAFADDKF